MIRNPALQSELPLQAPSETTAGSVIELDGRLIRYTLRRTRRRRSISLLIDERGLRVAAPLKAPQRAIDDLLREHAAWVIRKVHDWQQQRPPARSWIAGEQLMLFGAPVTLEAGAGIAGLQLENGRLLFDPRLTPCAIESAARNWLKQQALSYFIRRCAEYSALLDLPAPTVRLSSARTRWGSCHAGGRIRMNWRLVQAPTAWIDYVAAHEVSHLRQMNHSPAFWRTVATLVDDFSGRRAALRREAHRYLLL